MSASTDELARWAESLESLAVLTGAGVSTRSGIPDYRDRNGDWKQANQPIQFAEFSGSEAFRRRYWARSYVGWRRFGNARPNQAHFALAKMEAEGRIDTLITQNVDRLHSRAGSRRVIDLHGDLGKVRCIDCDESTSREAFQSRLRSANPDWHAKVFEYRPDGDAELAENGHEDFRVPDCESCHGRMKPDVVMFGENVPKARVDASMAAVDRADALLVAGSSLMIFSGYRFARRAHQSGKPVAIVNRGKTRADDIAALKVDADCGEVLAALTTADDS